MIEDQRSDLPRCDAQTSANLLKYRPEPCSQPQQDTGIRFRHIQSFAEHSQCHHLQRAAAEIIRSPCSRTSRACATLEAHGLIASLTKLPRNVLAVFNRAQNTIAGFRQHYFRNAESASP